LFIGREKELLELKALTQTDKAKLSVIKGRRRIGKSCLLKEFGATAKGYKFFYFTSMAPEEGITAQDERDYFAKQLTHIFSIPVPPATDWTDLLWTLADRLKLEKKSIVVFDEINWMGQNDPTFLAKLKEAWDGDFSVIKSLLLFLSGSLASWINANILHHTGFVGRISLDMTLEVMPLSDCFEFWGKHNNRVSTHEKLDLLCVTGGVPRYIEELDPKQSVEQNLLRLCYNRSGLLFREFDNLFADLFSSRNTSYRRIIEILAKAPTDMDDLYKTMDISKSGWLSDRVNDLVASGFIVRDHTWSLKNGVESKLNRLRLSDNYLRFYLKGIAPYANRIKRHPLDALPNIVPVLGLQFENIILANRQKLWQQLNVKSKDILNENPFFQRPTKRQPGCQIDYLIQTTRHALYICEIKYHNKPLGMSIIAEVEAKTARLKMPKACHFRPVLICVNGVTDEVVEADYFDAIIDVEALV
jgi:hypothetical protein